MEKKRILITGATGTIGSVLSERLSEYELILTDRTANNSRLTILTDLADSDSTNRSLNPLLPIDAIIHLAGDSNVESTWESSLRDNIIASQSIFEFARRNMIGRIVFASSNHVTGGYEGYPPSLHTNPRPHITISPDSPIRPDSYYAVSKAFGEALGRYFSDVHGIDVICLRLGTILANDNPLACDRFRATWLSHRDLVQLIRRSIDAPVHFGIYYGVSNNARRFWSLENALSELSYQPADNADEYFT